MSELVDGILLESDLSGDHALRGLLAELERDSIAVRPMPSAELAALLRPGRAARRRSHRTSTAVITGIVVIGTLALGAGAAAASPAVRSAFGSALGTIVHLVAPDAVVPWLDSDGATETGTTNDMTAPDVDAPPASPTPPPAPTPAPNAVVLPVPVSSDPGSGDGSNASTTGESHGNGHSDDHGNGKGNQSGHGNGKGQGNGGPAPVP